MDRKITKEDILKYFNDINYVYNDCSRYETLSQMIDELLGVDRRMNAEDFVYDILNDIYKCYENNTTYDLHMEYELVEHIAKSLGENFSVNLQSY